MPDPSARATVLADALATLRPRLHDQPVVYAVVARGYDAAEAWATVREQEGLTVLVDQSVADADGLVYEFVGAIITLGVETDLELVGLTAAVATALAEAGLPCNVLAGFHHDHLVVPWDRRHDAMAVLAALR